MFAGQFLTENFTTFKRHKLVADSSTEFYRPVLLLFDMVVFFFAYLDTKELLLPSSVAASASLH